MSKEIEKALRRVDPRIRKRTVMEYAEKDWKPGVDEESDTVLATLTYFNRGGDPLDFGDELSRPDLPEAYRHDPIDEKLVSKKTKTQRRGQ